MSDFDHLRAVAEAAKANSPNWCGQNPGTWTQSRALVNFRFIQAASPDVVLALLDSIAEPKGDGYLADKVRRLLSINDHAEAEVKRLAIELMKAQAELAKHRTTAKDFTDSHVQPAVHP